MIIFVYSTLKNRKFYVLLFIKIIIKLNIACLINLWGPRFNHLP
jgi:hypothetical protein